jgi:hypothetical protein
MLGAVLSCTHVLEQAPKGALSLEILKNKDGAEALVVACYSLLNNVFSDSWSPIAAIFNPASDWESGDLRSDDCYKGGGGTGDVGELNSIELGIVEPSNSFFENKWRVLFYGVSRCNKALRILNEIPDNGYPERTKRIAEVKVLRGWYYFELKKHFRTFPYVDEKVAAGSETAIPNNLSEQQLWDKIIADFNEGINIPYDGQDAGRVNKYVAYAMLCYAHMFTKNYVLAITDADQLINDGKYHLIANMEWLYSDPHHEHDGENVFAMETNIGAGATNNVRFNWGDLWTCPPGPYGGGDGFQRPSQNLVNAFQVDPVTGLPLLDTYNDNDLAPNDITTPVDPRLDHAIGRPGITWKDYTVAPYSNGWAREAATYGPYSKKKNIIYVYSDLRAGGGGDFPWAGGALNFPFIKISDIMLLKAEALVEQNQSLDMARDLVNQIRSRAQNTPVVNKFGSPGVPAANYQIGLYAGSWAGQQDYARKAVRFERRIELCLEGHRFFDLVRWGIAKSTLDNYINTEKTKRIFLSAATYNGPKIDFYPVPQNEIDLSKGVLKQDQNY